MKRASQLHYTATPMLNPERKGTGLFSSITSIDAPSEFDFDEVDMMDFFEKPRVNIGTDYQATLPSDNARYEDRKPCETLLWKPSVLEDDRQLDRYVDLAKSSAVPMGMHSIESALKILMESQGEVHVAVLRLLQSSDKSLEKRWSQTEMEQFLKGLEKHGKDFATIARDILHKTTGDCVQLYYFWKKLCNEYKSTHLPRQSATPSMRECNFIANNKHNNNDDDFFDYVDSTLHNNNNNDGIQSNLTTVNGIHSAELRPHVCEVPDCSAVS
jgi:ELM2 domain/Myb-like DNA-binding domain